MLKIKDNKWDEFENKANEFGFEMNGCNNGYCKRFCQESECPDDYLDIQIWLDDKIITIGTNNYRYAGFDTDGEELTVLFELIINGFVEKV